MKLAWFGVEEWLNPMDSLARINLGSSCVSALRMDELFDLTGEDLDAFLNEMRTMSLHYHHGDATGSPRIKAAVAGIYPKGNVKPEEVMITHGGTGANDLVGLAVAAAVAVRSRGFAAITAGNEAQRHDKRQNKGQKSFCFHR